MFLINSESLLFPALSVPCIIKEYISPSTKISLSIDFIVFSPILIESFVEIRFLLLLDSQLISNFIKSSFVFNKTSVELTYLPLIGKIF